MTITLYILAVLMVMIGATHLAISAFAPAERKMDVQHLGWKCIQIGALFIIAARIGS